jgi:excisionase family DNA binding protein
MTAQSPPNGHAPLESLASSERSQLLTADQLAARWQVPKSQVYRLARDGRLPVVTVGRYYRFKLDAIERWDEAGG